MILHYFNVLILGDALKTRDI